MLAGDNIPYNIDGTYTIEDIITPLEKSIGHVIRYNTCAEGVSAGQYVYLILSGISDRSDGLYRAVNAKSAGTIWTSADLAPVAGGLGALMASNDSAISELNSNLIQYTTKTFENVSITNSSSSGEYYSSNLIIDSVPDGKQIIAVTLGDWSGLLNSVTPYIVAQKTIAFMANTSFTIANIQVFVLYK